MKKRNRRLFLETLEDRQLLYAVTPGISAVSTWHDPQRITYSIMPDGAQVYGGVPSNLAATMAANGITSSNYEHAIDSAFYMWGANLGINFVKVSDDGANVGSDNTIQGNPGHGDIRVGMFAEGATFGTGYAFSPPPLANGDMAGDIYLNSDVYWGNSWGYDLFTVMEHEIGHSLGMDHSTDTSSVMYPTLSVGTVKVLNMDDVSGGQTIYPANRDYTGVTSAASPYYFSQANLTQTFSGLRAFYGQSQTFVFNSNIGQQGSTSETITVSSQGISSFTPKITATSFFTGQVITASAVPSFGGSSVTVDLPKLTSNFWKVEITTAAGGYAGGAYTITSTFGMRNPPNTEISANYSTGSWIPGVNSIWGVGTADPAAHKTVTFSFPGYSPYTTYGDVSNGFAGVAPGLSGGLISQGQVGNTGRNFNPNPSGGQLNWEDAVINALAFWQKQLGVNFVQVDEINSGTDYWQTNITQGAVANHGDIRFFYSGYPSSHPFEAASPGDYTSDRAGDVVFNSTYYNYASNPTFFKGAITAVGKALGLNYNSDPTSIMGVDSNGVPNTVMTLNSNDWTAATTAYPPIWDTSGTDGRTPSSPAILDTTLNFTPVPFQIINDGVTNYYWAHPTTTAMGTMTVTVFPDNSLFTPSITIGSKTVTGTIPGQSVSITIDGVSRSTASNNGYLIGVKDGSLYGSGGRYTLLVNYGQQSYTTPYSGNGSLTGAYWHQLNGNGDESSLRELVAFETKKK